MPSTRSATPTAAPLPEAPARAEPAGCQAVARREAATAWGRQLIAAALPRLQAALAPACRLRACRVQRCAGRWTVHLIARVDAGPSDVSRPARGVGRAMTGPDWVAGDLRLALRLQLAMAEAAADLAEDSGLGLALFRRPACAPGPRAGSSRPPAGCRCGSARR